MKLPNSARTSKAWRVHALAYDFVLEDVWKLPTPGGPRDLDRIVRWFADDQGELSAATRVLFAIRWRLGGLLGWDRAESGVGSRVRSVRGRLPEDLARGPRGPDTTSLPFTSVFQTDDEWVAEMSNSTVHALLHLGWIEDAPGSYHAQMAVLVKPNGWLGRTYMAAILPARRAIVYPSLLRTIGRDWRRSAGQPAPRREEAAS